MPPSTSRASSTRSSSGEQRRLAGIGGDGHDDAIENVGRATHEVVVTVGDRIERAGIHGAGHGESSLSRRTSTAADDSRPGLPACVRCTVQPAGNAGNGLVGRTLDVDPAHQPRASRAPSSSQLACSRPEAKGGSRKTTSNGCGGRVRNRQRIARRGPSPPIWRQDAASVCVRCRADSRLAIHERNVRRAARQRLDAQRAAAREEIEAARAENPGLQPVEERFAHAIRRRTHRPRSAGIRCARRASVRR